MLPWVMALIVEQERNRYKNSASVRILYGLTISCKKMEDLMMILYLCMYVYTQF